MLQSNKILHEEEYQKEDIIWIEDIPQEEMDEECRDEYYGILILR